MNKNTTTVVVLILTLLCILAFMIPLTECIKHNKDKEIELQKYKIEMQSKHGDIGEV